jgi:hypothetical protein
MEVPPSHRVVVDMRRLVDEFAAAKSWLEYLQEFNDDLANGVASGWAARNQDMVESI